MLAAVCGCAGGCVGADPPGAIVVERVDSAGIEIVVAPDGAVFVYDYQQGGFVRFTAEGHAQDAWRPGLTHNVVDAAFTDRGLLIGHSDWSRSGEVIFEELLLFDEAGHRSLMSVPVPRPGFADFPSFGMGLALTPIFAPGLVWGAGGRQVTVNRQPIYEISVFTGGELVRMVRRDIVPVPVDADLAMRAVPEGMVRTSGPSGPVNRSRYCSSRLSESRRSSAKRLPALIE